MSFTPRKTILIMIALVSSVLLLAACSSNSTSTASTQSTVVKNVALNAGAILQHSPAGSAQLAWNPTSRALSVDITLLGLVPMSKHPAHIHAGTCAKEGGVVYTLQDVVANEAGVGTSTSTINNVTGGIPETGWYINVHNGPGMSSDLESMPISCGNIVTPNLKATSAQNIHIPMTTAVSASQAASGNAQLKLANGKLTVMLSLQGLAPNTVHAANLYNGGCGNQGKVLYTLKPIIADKTGKGSTTTVITGISSVPDAGWYVSVHQTTNLTTQAGSDSIVCGDVLTGP
jgi:CHRD domain